MSVQTPVQQCTVPRSMGQVHSQVTVLQGWVWAHRSAVWKASPNSQAALRSAAQPSAGRFPRICSQVTGDPADPQAACRSAAMFSSLHGPCHSDHMLVRLPKPGHRTQSNSCIRLIFWDSQRAAETDTETPMQEQGKDQNGNGDIWHNSSDANGYDLTRF